MQRVAALLALVISVAVPAVAGSKDKDTVFSAPREKVYAVALDTITREWSVKEASKESGVISFRARTGGMYDSGDMNSSAVILESGAGTSVTVNTELHGSIAESKIRKKVLRLIGERLFKDGLIPESEVPKK